MALAAGSLAAAMGGSAFTQDSTPQAAEADFAPVSKEKVKKSKKKSDFEWSEPDPAPVTVDEPAYTTQPPPDDRVEVVAETMTAHDEPERRLEANPDAIALPENITPMQVNAEPALEEELTSSLSRKQSKKDKKKKNRQSSAWEPEPEPESQEAATGQPASAVEEPQEPQNVLLPADEPEFVTEQTRAASEDPEVASVHVEKPIEQEDSRPSLSRKQSKKDKKKKKKQFIAWEPEPQVESGANEEATTSSFRPTPLQSEIETVVAPDIIDDAQNVPLPDGDDDELSEGTPVTYPTTPDNIAEPETTGERDPDPIEATTEPATVSSDTANDNSSQDVGPQLPGAWVDEAEEFSANTNDVDHTDDFFSPADPLLEDPSRMTEDLDAFGEMDEAAVEKENRRAAREAADAAAVAEASRPRPQDDNYAALMAARKPVGGKKNKKGRKSISSVFWEESTSGEQTSKSDEQASSGAATPAVNADEAQEIALIAAPEDVAPTGETPSDEFEWAPGLKKKGKKNKKTASSIVGLGRPEACK
jgi:hypothetical protein